MSVNNDLVFNNKSEKPNELDIKESLKSKFDLFESIITENNFDEAVWKFYNKNSGWTLQCKIKNRNIMYIQIIRTGFYVWFTLGKKAKENALKSTISEKIKDEIKSSKVYREGTSFKVDVEDKNDLDDISVLIKIKLDN